MKNLMENQIGKLFHLCGCNPLPNEQNAAANADARARKREFCECGSGLDARMSIQPHRWKLFSRNPTNPNSILLLPRPRSLPRRTTANCSDRIRRCSPDDFPPETPRQKLPEAVCKKHSRLQAVQKLPNMQTPLSGSRPKDFKNFPLTDSVYPVKAQPVRALCESHILSRGQDLFRFQAPGQPHRL